jgi:hypothetical protein
MHESTPSCKSRELMVMWHSLLWAAYLERFRFACGLEVLRARTEYSLVDGPLLVATLKREVRVIVGLEEATEVSNTRVKLE